VQSSGAECQKEDSLLEGMHSIPQEEHRCSFFAFSSFLLLETRQSGIVRRFDGGGAPS
jgi:hypothetical protein